MATPSSWKWSWTILKTDSSPFKSSSFSSHSTLSFLIIHHNRTTLSSISPTSSSSSTTICSAGPRKRLKKPGTLITTDADDLNGVVVSGIRIKSVKRPNLSFKSLFGKRALWRRILFASTKVRSIILLNLITVIYASNIPVLKEVEAIMDPAAFTVVRFALTAIPFIPFVFRARGDIQTRNAGMELGLWVSLGYLMQALGLLTSDAGRASFLSMFTVIVVPLIDGMLGAVIPARTWFGALMSIIGVGMLECSGSPPNIGDLLNFLSAVFFGVHMLRTEHISRSTDKENFLPLLGYEVCVVALFSAVWYFVGLGGIQDYNPSSWTWTQFSDWMMVFPWVPALYTGIFSTGICLWVELAAMCDVSATETAIIYGLEPVWGAGFAWFLLGERWGISGWIGAVLVLGGSLMVQIYGATSPTLPGKRNGTTKEENSALVSEAQNGLSAVPVSIRSIKDVPNNTLKKKYKVQVREGVKIPESFELILVDSEGARIQATIPKMFMHKYGPKMNECAVYYISNFSVVENRGKYRITEHPLKIIFFNSTDIYSVTGLSFPKKVFSLMSFPDLLALTDVDDCGLIDVVGRLVRKSKVKHIHNQRTSPGEKLIEVVLEDIGNNSLNCTLWGDYADEMFSLIETCGDSPLIVLIQLCKPKSYDGKISISNAFFATKLHVDPIVPEIAELKSLFAVESGSSHKISQIESSNAYSSYDELESGLANVLTVADLLECKEEGYFWVIGQISEVFVDGCWSFISCKVCMHKLDSVESGYFCKGCNNNITKAIPRYKVKVNVHSGDETAKFMLWDRCCETLVGQSAVELKDHYIKITESGRKEYCLPHCPDEIIAIVGKTAIFKVHLRDVNLSGKDQNYSSGSCFHGKSLVDKYIKEKIKVKKRIDVLAAIKEAGDEVIEINDSCGDNEEKTPENVGLKRRFLSFEDTATSTLTGDGGSSNKDGIQLQKEIKIEKD